MEVVIRLNIDGNPQKPETLLAEKIGIDTYRLLVSPGFVVGVAGGDVIELHDGDFRIIERGGNVCIQVYVGGGRTAPVDAWLTPLVAAAGGRRDGLLEKGPNGVIVYTIPVAVGFPRIQEPFEKLKATFPEADWYYGNTYDPKDGVTPLNWWVK